MQTQQIHQMIQSSKQQITRLLQFTLFQKNYQKSLDLIQQLIDLDQQNSQYYKTKTNILYMLNRFNQALITSSIAVNKGQNSIDFYNLIIKCHLQTDNLQLAQDTISKVLSWNQSVKHFIELIQTVQKLKNNTLYAIPQEQQKIMTEMKQWLYPKGAAYDKVKIVNQRQGYRGAIAIKSIKKNQTFIFIPKSQLISLQLARQNSISKQLIRQNVQLLSPKHSLISILLLQQKLKGNSRFKPYIDILPKDHSCFPINYTAQQLSELIGSTFIFQIRQKVLDLKRDYDMICYHSQQFVKKYTFKDFCWARMMVGSRVFGLHIDGVKTQVLAPFADMLNHKVPKQTVWNYSQQKQGFFIQSLKDINVGEELFDSYGKKCNSRFLLNYGFVLQNNDRNQICLKIDFDEKDPTLLKKLSMLKVQKETAMTKIFKINKNLQQNHFFEMMGYLRLKNIQKFQTLNILQKISQIQKTNQGYKPSRTPPTTLQVELKIWAELKRLCQYYLNGYATTLQQDKLKLKQQNLSENMRNILILRIGQKQLYQYYQQISGKVLQILSKGYVQARQTAQKQLHLNYYRYIQKILNLMPHQKNQILRNNLKLEDKNLLQHIQVQNLDQDDEIQRDQ